MQDVEGLILRLKNHPLSQESCVLALECNWDRLLQEVDELITQLGFEYFSYSVFTCAPFEKAFKSDPHEQGSGSKFMGAALNDVLDACAREVVVFGSAWNELESADKPVFVGGSSGGNPQANTFWVKKGINSRVYLPMPSNSKRLWFNYFTLYHKVNVEELRELFSMLEEWLIPMLERYHRLLQAVNQNEPNPFIRNQLFSDTCLSIVRMTAEGMPVKRIADVLSLTEEGITYHITRAKRLFQAKNKTQLIALMYEAGLL